MATFPQQHFDNDKQFSIYILHCAIRDRLAHIEHLNNIIASYAVDTDEFEEAIEKLVDESQCMRIRLFKNYGIVSVI